MTMAVSSLMLMFSLIPALSLASEAEAVPEAVNIQLGGSVTLNCGEEAEPDQGGSIGREGARHPDFPKFSYAAPSER